MRIEVVYAELSRSWSAHIECEDECTVAQAIGMAFELDEFSDSSINRADGYSIWGEVVDRSHKLSDGDRLEILRKLKHDPMQLRRINAKR